MKDLVYDLSFMQLSSLVAGWGHPGYRSTQVWQGLYKNLWTSPHEFTNLPLSLHEKLDQALEFQPLTPIVTQTSSDNQTIKTMFRLRDGNLIETVLMMYDHADSLGPQRVGNHQSDRRTLCISTQAGCAMGCVFCATGQMGFKRNLSQGEIIGQVMYFARKLKDDGDWLTNIVLMGMGEPFHNYDQTMAAIDQMNDPGGFNFGARRFTISTVGLLPAIKRFTQEKRQINLAVSLHSVDDHMRSQMMPINKRYPVDDLLEACREYTLNTGRRITFEWALIQDVNDTPEQARLLAAKVKDILCHINAIPLNPTALYEGKAASLVRANQFKNILLQAGIPCTIRLRRGIDIEAGCGQLIIKSSNL